MDEIETEAEGSASTEIALSPAAEAADDNQEMVAPLETVQLPVFALLAALSVTPTAKMDKPNFASVHVIGLGDSEVRIEATDGHRAFFYSLPLSGEMPAWLTTGVNLPLQSLDKRLKLLEAIGPSVQIAFATGAPHLVLSDAEEHVVMRLVPAGNDFPPLQPILDRLKLGEHKVVDLDSVAYAPGYLKAAGAMAAMLSAEQVRMFGTAASEGDPTLFTFPGCDGAVLLLMPHATEQSLPRSTAHVLSGAIAGTMAALKAHRTRWAQKLEHAQGERAKKTIENKIDEYDRRIDRIFAQTNPVPALPAPAVASAEAAAEEAEALFDDHAPDRPVVPPMATTEDQVSAWAAGSLSTVLGRDRRAKLKGAAAKRSVAKFNADTNAVLSRDYNGLTLSQLADGVPIDEWYEIGLSPEDAAKRCLPWRQVASVLPPDEVAPGEAELPIAALGDGEDAA